MSFPRFNKFNVSPSADRTYNGRVYGSKAEMQYAMHLDILRDTRAIIEYIEQPKFKLGVPENVYVADFLVIEFTEFEGYCGQDAYVVDVKGMQTPKFKHDKKLWAAYGKLPLHIIKLSGKRFKTVEVIDPNLRRAAA